MAAKIIFAILATVTSQINADVAQLVRGKDNLGPPPALPEDEGRLGLYTQTIEPQCYCQYGYSMCVTNPYDASEVRCLLSCYKQAFPYLNLNDYEWICSALPYQVPQARRDNLDEPENKPPQIPHDHDGSLRAIDYGPQAKTNSSIGAVDVPYKIPVNAPYRAGATGVDGPYKGPVDAPYRAPMNEPYKGPVIAPYRAPVNAPYRAPVDGAYKGPVNGPYKGPVNAPYRAPVNEPYKGPVDGPYRGPADGTHRGPIFGANRGTVDGPYRGPNNS